MSSSANALIVITAPRANHARRPLSRVPRRVDVGHEALTFKSWSILDDALAGESTRLTNRIRGLLSQIHRGRSGHIGMAVPGAPSSGQGQPPSGAVCGRFPGNGVRRS
jgi:hypothetical protein